MACQGVPRRIRWGLSSPKMKVMAAPKKPPDDLRERATRMAVGTVGTPPRGPERWPGSARRWASVPRRCAAG